MSGKAEDRGVFASITNFLENNGRWFGGWGLVILIAWAIWINGIKPALEARRVAVQKAEEELRRNPPPPVWTLVVQTDSQDKFPVEVEGIVPRYNETAVEFEFVWSGKRQRIYDPIFKKGFQIDGEARDGILCKYLGDNGAAIGYAFLYWYEYGGILRGYTWCPDLQSGKSREELRKNPKLTYEARRKNKELLKKGGDIVIENELTLTKQ